MNPKIKYLAIILLVFFQVSCSYKELPVDAASKIIMARQKVDNMVHIVNQIAKNNKVADTALTSGATSALFNRSPTPSLPRRYFRVE